MAGYYKFLYFLICFSFFYEVLCDFEDMIDDNVVTLQAFTFWPQALVPFYINPDHYDHEQSLSIMNALAYVAFKSCVKFVPVMAPPEPKQHVMVFHNPEGVRKCVISTGGHNVDEPHFITMGYDCLRAPEVDMIILRALGMPFEHNRSIRDVYVDLQTENIEPSALDLFAKEFKMPLEFRHLPYDVDSVMHFGDREFSKNGHRTIIFKDPKTVQKRHSLSPLDIRKLEIVYGPECRKRERAEKIELCQNIPDNMALREGNFPPPNGNNINRLKREVYADPELLIRESSEDFMRRKRSIDGSVRSLRVNPDITPPAHLFRSFDQELDDLGIKNDVDNTIESLYKLTGIALAHARTKYCNQTKVALRRSEEKPLIKPSHVSEIVWAIVNYTRANVNKALANLTILCEEDGDMTLYQRAACPFFNPINCPKSYRSTHSGLVRHSTQHRPLIRQSTNNYKSPRYIYARTGPDTDNNTNAIQSVTEEYSAKEATQTKARKKRAAEVKSTTLEEFKKVVEAAVATSTVVAESEVTTSKPASDVAGTTKATVKPDNAETAKPAKVAKKDGPTSAAKKQKSVASKKQRKLLRAGTGNVTSRPKSKGLKIRLPLSLGNSTNKGWQTWAPPRTVTTTTVPANNTLSKELSAENENATVSISVTESVTYVALKNGTDAVSTEVTDADNSTTTEESRPKRELDTRRKYYQSRRIRKSSDAKSATSNKKTGDSDRRQNESRSPKKSKDKKKPKRDDNDIEYVKMDDETDEESKKADDPKRQGPVPNTLTLTKKNIEFYRERMWPDGAVRYVIQEDKRFDLNDVRRRLHAVNKILKSQTCTSIEEIKMDETERYEDYLVLDDSPDYVTGKVGGKQNFGALELLKGGQHRQHAAMVVMAMLGFYFEVSRHDRDKYIRVHLRHVRPDKLHHFEKIRDDATFDCAYDYQSATHPAWQFWRQIGRTGISTVATYKEQDPDGSLMKSLGQNDALLSETDILKINSVYGTECFGGVPGIDNDDDIETNTDQGGKAEKKKKKTKVRKNSDEDRSKKQDSSEKTKTDSGEVSGESRKELAPDARK